MFSNRRALEDLRKSELRAMRAEVLLLSFIFYPLSFVKKL
jgi:hypothetical protein